MASESYGHYTTPRGLLGIIKNEVLWASNIKFLNDEQEFQHAIDLIRDIAPKRVLTPDNPLRSVFIEFQAKVKEKLDTLDAYKAESVFTLSFSAQTDLLSQWRGYCPGNNGYCIVFDLDKLFATIKGAFRNCYLLKCVYDESEKDAALRKVLSKGWVGYQRARDPRQKEAVANDLTTEVRLLASHFKHPSFAEEQEKRVVVLLDYNPDNPIFFREARSSLIPYVELPAPRALIQKVVIGPNANQALAKRALEAFIERSYGMPIFVSDVGVELSKTPYRPLP